MTSPYTLIQDAVSHSTVGALEQLLEQARRGEVVGLGFVAMLKRRRYIANSAGECRRDPTLTLGMVKALEYELSSLVHSASFSDTHL